MPASDGSGGAPAPSARRAAPTRWWRAAEREVVGGEAVARGELVDAGAPESTPVVPEGEQERRIGGTARVRRPASTISHSGAGRARIARRGGPWAPGSVIGAKPTAKRGYPGASPPEQVGGAGPPVGPASTKRSLPGVSLALITHIARRSRSSAGDVLFPDLRTEVLRIRDPAGLGVPPPPGGPLVPVRLRSPSERTVTARPPEAVVDRLRGSFVGRSLWLPLGLDPLRSAAVKATGPRQPARQEGFARSTRLSTAFSLSPEHARARPPVGHRSMHSQGASDVVELGAMTSYHHLVGAPRHRPPGLLDRHARPPEKLTRSASPCTTRCSTCCRGPRDRPRGSGRAPHRRRPAPSAPGPSSATAAPRRRSTTSTGRPVPSWDGHLRQVYRSCQRDVIGVANGLAVGAVWLVVLLHLRLAARSARASSGGRSTRG